MKKNNLKTLVGSTEGFFTRVRKRAAVLDRGEDLPQEITITFEDPAELLSVLTGERVRLLQQAKKGELPISRLASTLKRDVRSVSRDVKVLEDTGLLRTSYQANPGHGRVKAVAPVAKTYNLAISI